MTTQNNTDSKQDGAPERVFLKACHPASPNRYCSWDVSKTQEDSVEYIRADLASRASVAAPGGDAHTERKAVIGLIERFQREPHRSAGTIDALEWLRRQIVEGNHAYHKFEPPTVGFAKPDECSRCGMPGNALTHLLVAGAAASSSLPAEPKLIDCVLCHHRVTTDENGYCTAMVILRREGYPDDLVKCGCHCAPSDKYDAEPLQPEGKQERRLLTRAELEDIEKFQRQRRKSPVPADAWLYVAEIDRLLTHIRVDREQLENEIFQDATDPHFAVTPPDTPVADIAGKIAAEIAFRINGGEDDENLSYPKPLSDLMDDSSIANERAFASWLESIITRHLAAVPVRQEWLPIEVAPKSDTTWLVVAKIADSEPNKGALLWWYRAMFWRGAWHTTYDYSARVKPTHFCNPEQFAAATTSPTSETPAQSEVHICKDEESRDLATKLALIEQRFDKATTHHEVAALVWAGRALIDADAEEAPFFTMEYQDKTLVYTAVLGLYFQHAKRVLGREPYPAEVDQIETGFCNPWLEAKKPERMERGRQLLNEIVSTAPVVATRDDEGEENL